MLEFLRTLWINRENIQYLHNDLTRIDKMQEWIDGRQQGLQHSNAELRIRIAQLAGRVSMLEEKLGIKPEAPLQIQELPSSEPPWAGLAITPAWIPPDKH